MSNGNCHVSELVRSNTCIAVFFSLRWPNVLLSPKILEEKFINVFSDSQLRRSKGNKNTKSPNIQIGMIFSMALVMHPPEIRESARHGKASSPPARFDGHQLTNPPEKKKKKVKKSDGERNLPTATKNWKPNPIRWRRFSFARKKWQISVFYFRLSTWHLCHHRRQPECLEGEIWEIFTEEKWGKKS